MIKALIFDWFGVSTVENWSDCMVRKMKADYDIEEAAFRKAFNPLLQSFARNDLTPDEFLEKLVRPLLPQADPKQFAFLFNTLPELNHELLDYIKSLKQHYPTYLLSNNFGPVFPNYEKMIRLGDYFTELLLSHKLNMSKVDDSMWPGILSKLPYKPAELLFIDNKEQYAAVAREHGVNTIVFHDNQQVMHDINETLANN
jgi:FMN phosphatase YigB (HAD superfamily)